MRLIETKDGFWLLFGTLFGISPLAKTKNSSLPSIMELELIRGGVGSALYRASGGHKSSMGLHGLGELLPPESLGVWTVVFIVFLCVILQYRVLFGNLVSFIWNIYLAMLRR